MAQTPFPIDPASVVVPKILLRRSHAKSSRLAESVDDRGRGARRTLDVYRERLLERAQVAATKQVHVHE